MITLAELNKRHPGSDHVSSLYECRTEYTVGGPGKLKHLLKASRVTAMLPGTVTRTVGATLPGPAVCKITGRTYESLPGLDTDAVTCPACLERLQELSPPSVVTPTVK